LRSAAALALSLSFVLATAPGRAEPATPRSPAPATSRQYSLEGFDFLASAGWGASTATVGELELAPYGTNFGGDIGYTWPVGFRLAAHFDAGLGRGVVHQRDVRRGRDFDFTADTSSLNGGFSMGWDVPLYMLLLRYTVRLGVTSMRWDFGGTRRPVEFDDVSNPVLGLHVAPGVAVLWPYRWFEGGVGFDFMAQANGTIPSGFVGKVLVGVRP
jgi:hypothetical protein